MPSFFSFKRLGCCALFIALGVVSLRAQSPYNGIYIEKINLPQTFPDIEAQTPGASVYRVYVCVNDPFWELQAVFGYNAYPLTLNPEPGKRFFQAAFGGPTSLALNPAFYAFFPVLEFDSFMTIGRLNSTNNSLSVISNPLDPTLWFQNFENNGGGFDFSDPTGTSFYVAVNRSPPIPPGGFTDQNIPTPEYRILVAQLTTNGTFSGVFNFQFRRLNADYTTFVPVESLQISGIAINSTPGVMDEVCQTIFLPVGLLSFEAYPEIDHVALRWVTETEVNNDYFAIERSKDGIAFEEIARMDGAGTTSNQRVYYTIDPDPYQGVSYYRLRQTDFNGEFEYTDVIAVYFDGMKPEIALYPNPSVGDEVFVNGHTEELKRYRMFSSEGKLLLDKETNGEAFYGIEIEHLNLPAGMYYFEFITNDNRSLRQKLIVD